MRLLRAVRRPLRRCAALALVSGLLVTACSDSTDRSWTGPVGNDINPQDPAQLRDGGELRLAIPEFPQNFNPLVFEAGAYADYAGALYPTAFLTDANGSPAVNTDYFTAVELTSGDPQVVVYTINPAAVWSDGTPITWIDIRNQWDALKGVDPAFDVMNTAGFDQVEAVTRGIDDRQAVMSFTTPYTDWRGMFGGTNVLLPRTMTATIATFDNAQREVPGISAGPFIVTNVDRPAKRIVMGRNPKWWGAKPRLDNITFVTVAPADQLRALQNEEVDAVHLTSAIDIAIARRMPGIAARQAPSLRNWLVYFNGCDDCVLADKALRRAIVRGIDRDSIAEITQRGVSERPIVSANHIFAAGQAGYEDNSYVLSYDPDAARGELDALGWKFTGQRREKDGRPLIIQDVYVNDPAQDLLAQLLDDMMAGIGVDLQLHDISVEDRMGYDGGYDMTHWETQYGAFPLSRLNAAFGTGGPQNYTAIASPELDAAIAQTVSELDESKARELANGLDVMLWEEGRSVPLVRNFDTVAVRETVYNYGAFGAADIDFTAIGFLPV